MQKDTLPPENKWALILGGSKGLGLATAKKLSKHGYSICIVHRDRKTDLPDIQKEFETLKTSPSGFLAFNIDAINAQKREEALFDIKKVLGENGRIKILVHSIAKGNLKPMLAADGRVLSTQDIEITFNAMALSLYEWVQDIVKAKLFAPDMRIISFTSEGNTRALPGYGAVSVAKVALEALTRNMAVELAPLGIKANCIQAGVTETTSFAMIPNSDKIKEHAQNRNPNNRLTTPEDVANVVYLLTMDEARWITGTTIKVDGGESLR